MLDVAIKAAKAGAETALKFFDKTPKIFSNSSSWKNFVELKPDNSPVTIADKTAENVIRDIIGRQFPGHGIIGEEHPPTNPNSEYQWCIDPIDGTKQFIRKIPMWGTFVGLVKAGEPFLGAIVFPGANELYWAQKGKGAYLNGKKVRVSKVRELKNATMAHGTIKRFKKHNVLEGLMKLDEQIYSEINLGPYTIGQLIQGHIDISIDGGGQIWDFAAPAIIVEEAGGKFSDFSGKKSFFGNCSVMTNGLLHDKVVKLLNSR